MPAASPQHCTDVFHGLPLVLLGVILGNMADENLRRALILHNGSIVPFFTRPISLFFIIFILVLVLPQFAFFKNLMAPVKKLFARKKKA